MNKTKVRLTNALAMKAGRLAYMIFSLIGKQQNTLKERV